MVMVGNNRPEMKMKIVRECRVLWGLFIPLLIIHNDTITLVFNSQMTNLTVKLTEKLINGPNPLQVATTGRGSVKKK